MKNKPHKHKDTNVFKFKSFADRISTIDVRQNALYHIQHANEDLELVENATLFHKTYTKWNTLNLSEEYREFQKQIRGIVTLPQLLHQKEFIVQLLLDSLSQATTLSLQPLLEFVVILAKDLREEFYSHFPSFLEKLIHLLNTKDTDQLEWTLICLAYLFKALKPFLKKDITVVFNLILPLLGNRNPEHITNFAAECFSFIARDIKDKETFLRLVLSGLKKHKNGIDGCGRLFFDIIKGVNGNFHSCAEQFLAVLLSSLSRQDCDQVTLFEVVTRCVFNILQNINPNNIGIFWNVCLKQQEVNLKNAQENDQSIKNLLMVMGQLIEYRHGRFVSTTTEIIELLITLIDAHISSDTLMTVSEIVAVLLLSSNLNISQLDASRLTKKLLNAQNRSVFEAFVWNTVNYAQFEIFILPELLNYFVYNCSSKDQKPLELLANILLKKAPLCKSGINLIDWKRYPLKMKANGIKFIENRIINCDIEKLESFVLDLVIYPHLLQEEKHPQVIERLKQLLDETCKDLSEGTINEKDVKKKKAIFLLSIVIQTIIHIEQPKCIDFHKTIDTLLPYTHQSDKASCLGIIDLILSVQDASELKVDIFEKLHDELCINLSSSDHEIRLLTANIFKYFANTSMATAPGMSIFDIFFNVENIIPTVHTYRDQIIHLQKLASDLNLFESIQTTIYRHDPLRYLLGVMYINFNLLWKPVSNLIVSYSAHCSVDEFWEIFKSKMNEVTEKIRNASSNNDMTLDDRNISNNVILEVFSNYWQSDNRVDLLNYRILLWRILCDFGNLIEVKNRDIATFLLDFIKIEYRKSNDGETKTWNILTQLDNGVGECENIDDNLDAEEQKSNEPFKATQKTLVVMIPVFAKLANPKQVHRQPELYELYLELLCHRNPYIQKLALDCIMAYKHKYLMPYKEHLYGIIDEGKFKDAITLFKIDEGSNMLLPEHRNSIMPILMRILYSKMIARIQKGGGNTRKSLTMRFLGGCREDEILLLLQMAFGIYEKYFGDNMQIMSDQIIKEVDLEGVISPKKMQSSLNLIETIREQFAGLMGNSFLKYLLKILCIIASTVTGVLEKGKTINAVHAKLFKALRNDCLQSLTNFFNHFDTYPWTDIEIETIFHIFINPVLAKLPSDSLQSPTPLLKLLSTFGKNPRYFVLFTKNLNDDISVDTSALRYIIDLLLDPKAKPRVCLMIMEIVQNLLTLNDQDIRDSINVSKIIPINCRQPGNFSIEINFGSAILTPYIPQILDKFQQNLARRRGLTKRDLLILSRCTELILDGNTCRTLLSLLLPIIVRKSHFNAGEVVLLQMVQTIANLMERIEHPEDFIKDIAPMFEQINAVGPRKLLCDLLHKISGKASVEKQESLQEMAEIISELNSLDRRWVEQPDYERRLGAYKKIGILVQNEKLNLNFGLLLIYHSFYFIKYDKDMAMRDSASYHLKKLVPALVKTLYGNAVELDYLIGNVVLNLCRRTLSDSNENVRNEGILLLGELARECSYAHPVLHDLSLLTNKQDREVDFFDNITHLQHLRHGKALLKFCSVAKTLHKAPNSRTLTQFILPLASQYLCNEKHAAKHGLVTSAIETVGAVCRLIPWHQYESVLKFYLKKLRYNVEHQKQVVRIVMEILDAFHFDLSKANVNPQQLVENLKKSNKNEDDNMKAVEETTVKSNPDEEVDGEEEEVVLNALEQEDELFAEETNKIIDKEVEECDDMDDEESPTKKQKTCVYDSLTVLSHNAAKRLVHTIATGLVPTLNNSITMISAYERFHKLNKKKRKSEREEEEILRVPIALAVVKLLQKLPEGMLDHSLPGIFTKVCMFLKSPLRSVRMVSRDVLKNIMLTVGPSAYLSTLLNQLTTLLTKGFQVHVLTVTVYGILDALKTKLKAGDIDKVLQNILSVCLEDIFGQSSEEKEIFKISVATPEAKPSNKSYLSLHIVAINITESCMLDLLIPFKEYLIKYQSKSVVTKIQECFQKIVMGLILNKHISTQSLLVLIFGLTSESIPALLPAPPQPILTESEKEKIKRARPDCFLIQEEPRKSVIKKSIKTNIKANAHVMVEFGLELFHILLKRGKLLKIDYQQFVDPIVPILLDSLKSNQIRVTTFALKCLASLWNREMIVSKLEDLIAEIVPQIFEVLHKYATAGMSTSNENFNLVNNAFKAMVSLLRYAKYFQFSEDHLKTLLLYVEQNLHDGNKQTIAFSLLKVIIERKLMIAEMHEIMRKVSELAILSENSAARQDAKATIVNYLMDYPLGKKVNGFMKFFVSNLNYEVFSGRESVIYIIQAIIKRFPQEVLNANGGYLFLSLGAQLINEESPDCRKMIATCIESLLSKLDKTNRNQLFDIVLVLLADKKLTHREMAALLCSRFIIVEKEHFADRISSTLPVLIAALTENNPAEPGQFVRLPNAQNIDIQISNRSEQTERAKDHYLIQVTNTLLKILQNYRESLKESAHYIDELAYETQKLLAYEHSWVRFNATKILGIILSRIDIDLVLKIINTGETDCATSDFLYSNPYEHIKSVCLDMCAQMIPEETDKDMAEEIMKNCLYIANIVKDIPCEKPKDELNPKKSINLIWLIRRMRYIVHAEVGKAPHNTILRTAVFHWIEGIVELVSPSVLPKIAQWLMTPLVREMSDDDKNIDAKLKRYAIKVGDSIKARMNEDDYNLLRSQLQTKLMIKRAERRKTIAQTKVTDPVRAALRKQGEQKRKRLAKKRKFDEIKGRVAPKKKKHKSKVEEDVL